MKIRPLFAKYEKQLVRFANTRVGHLYLGTKNLPVVRVTPESIHYLKNIDNGIATIEADFWSRPVLLKKFRTALEIIALFDPDLRGLIANGDPYFFSRGIVSPADFNPDADPESTSCDGYSEKNYTLGSGVAWSTIRALATGSNANTDGNEVYADIHFDESGSGEWYHFRRGFLLFNTSTIGAIATVTATDLKVRSDGIIEDFADSVAVVSSNPASNTNIVTADYNQLGTTLYAPVIANDGSFKEDLSDNTFSFNANGLAAIDTSGITKLGWRNEADRTNSEPATGGLNTNDGARFDIKAADNGSNIPVLTVTFTLPVTGDMLLLF